MSNVATLRKWINRNAVAGAAPNDHARQFAGGDTDAIFRSASVLPTVEMMETRRLLSATTLRIAAYNIEDDINGNTTPLPGLYQVLEGIGEEQVKGNDQPIDILGLEETTSNADVQPIVTNLNSYYNGAATYAESSYQGTQDGGATDGNGPNALVYDTTTLKLVASVGVGTPEGATNGVYRQPIRYEFQPVGDSGSTGDFYVYVAHTKSGTTSADATDRGEEATVIRNDEATLPVSASVIYEGDLQFQPARGGIHQLRKDRPGRGVRRVRLSVFADRGAGKRLEHQPELPRRLPADDVQRLQRQRRDQLR